MLVEIYTSIAAMAGGRPPGRAKMRSFGELNQALDVLGSASVAGDGPIADHDQTDALLAAAGMRAVAHDRRFAPAGLDAESRAPKAGPSARLTQGGGAGRISSAGRAAVL